MKMIIQCDFDGTITMEDMGIYLLDTFAKGDWHHWVEQYRDNKITVGEFNSRAFAMVRAAGAQTLTETGLTGHVAAPSIVATHPLDPGTGAGGR